jgi:outer membrane protein TolC
MQDFETTRNNGSDQGYVGGVTAALPILDGGLRRSAVNEAQATVQQARADERDAVLKVNRDVSTALVNLSAAARNVGLSKAAVEQAEEDYRVIKLRYESGKAINVEVLDALAALTRALTNYADALYQHNVARDQLTRATGQRQ